MLVQADRTLRFSVIGALIIRFVGMSWNKDAISEAARERRLSRCR